MNLRRLSRRQWITAAALLAMVCSQAAFAAHLCPVESRSTPAVTATHPAPSTTTAQASNPVDCPHALGMALEEPAAEAACAAHCAHVTEASQQAKAPEVPAMLVAAPELAGLPCGTSEGLRAPAIDVHLPTVERRLVVFPSFQI